MIKIKYIIEQKENYEQHYFLAYFDKNIEKKNIRQTEQCYYLDYIQELWYNTIIKFSYTVGEVWNMNTPTVRRRVQDRWGTVIIQSNNIAKY